MSDIILPNTHQKECLQSTRDTTDDCDSGNDSGGSDNGGNNGNTGNNGNNGNNGNTDPDPPVTGNSVLKLKPETIISIQGQSIQYKAFLVGPDGAESEVTMGVKYRSSNTGIFPIGLTSGKGATVSSGDVTITAEWTDQVASASLKVVGACDELKVGTAIMIDSSMSMSQRFTVPPVGSNEIAYGTKFSMAKEVATAFAKDLQPGKDLQIVGTFGESVGFDWALAEGDMPDSPEVIDTIENMSLKQTGGTNLWAALRGAIDILGFGMEDELIDQPVILIFSDGESNFGPDPIPLANEFKSSGGIIAVVATRAHGDGFTLLKDIATEGVFFNAKQSNSGAIVETVRGMKGYWCAGNCITDGDGETLYNKGQLDYRTLINWDQPSDKYLDLIGGVSPNELFDFIPNNGLYLDLAGSQAVSVSGPDANLGKITTKTPIAVTSGQDYKLTVVMAGNQRSEVQAPTDEVSVKFLNPEISINDVVEIHNAGQGFVAYEWTFTAPSSDSGNIEIAFETGPNDSAYGILLGRVIFENLTTPATLFDDDFDEENPQTVPPKCVEDGDGGYVGGNSNCYGHGCLEEPIPPQSEDSQPLPVYGETISG